MNIPLKVARRTFVKKFANLGLAVTATLLARSARAGLVASQTADQANIDSSPLPTLSTADQNYLYSSALADADVSLLSQFIQEPVRLDPPRISMLGRDGSKSVVLPLASFATGSVTAVVLYGSNGVRMLTTNTGGIAFAQKGSLNIDTDQFAGLPEIAFASFFPDLFASYVGAVIGDPFITTTPVDTPGFLDPLQLKGKPPKKPTPPPVDPNPPCIASGITTGPVGTHQTGQLGCQTTYKACLAQDLNMTLAAVAAAALAAVLLAVCVNDPEPISKVAACAKAYTAVAAAVALIAAAASQLTFCKTSYRTCLNIWCGTGFQPTAG